MSYDENRISDQIDAGLHKMESEDELNEIYRQVFEAVGLYEKQVAKENLRKIKRCGKNSIEAFSELLEFCRVTGYITTTKQPTGTNQNERFGPFKSVLVDQWSVGDSGDSYEGYIYAKYNKRRWLKIPYSC